MTSCLAVARRPMEDPPSTRRSRERPEKPWWFPGYPSLRDAVTSLIGLLIIVYAGAVLWEPLHEQSAQTIAAIVGPILGAVIGYYFGAASGERAARQAIQRADEAVAERHDVADSSAAQMEAIRPLLDAQADFLDRIRPWIPEEEPSDGDQEPQTEEPEDAEPE